MFSNNFPDVSINYLGVLEKCKDKYFCVLSFRICSFLLQFQLLNLVLKISFSNKSSRSSALRNIYRSSHPEVFLRRGVLKICSKFTREHPCQSAISIKSHIFRTPFPRNTSGWLRLYIKVLFQV